MAEPEPSLPQPPKVEELPPGTPAASVPAFDEPAPASNWSWLGGLILAVLLFYFFAPASWKSWVVNQWQSLPWDKLPVEIAVKMKRPAARATPTPTPPSVSSDEASPAARPSLPVFGEVLIYRLHDNGEEATVQLTAQSQRGNVTEMQVWVDNEIPPVAWRPLATSTTVKIKERVFARFRDDLGNISPIYSDTVYPSYEPPSPQP